MFRLYAEAAVCYAYLSDVSTDLGLPHGLHETYYHASQLDEDETDDLSTFPLVDSFLDLEDQLLAHCPDFVKSRWFLRGWTLQELIAPTRVVFFDKSWKLIGDRKWLPNVIQKITAVDCEVFGKPSYLERYSIAQRMSWAALRTTTREEDQAYSLLGIFGINMPMLYGEGSRAFIRLQEAIMSRNSDQSIFAWDDAVATTDSIAAADNSFDFVGSIYDSSIRTTLLAPGPHAFSHCSSFRPSDPSRTVPFAITNAGVQITLPLCRLGQLDIAIYSSYATFGAILSRRIGGGWVGISLFKLEASSSVYYIYKEHGRRLQHFDALTAQTAEIQSLTIIEPKRSFENAELPQIEFQLEEVLNAEPHLAVDSIYPGNDWRSIHVPNNHDKVQAHRSHFTLNIQPTQIFCQGAILLVLHNGNYPLKIGVHFYFGRTTPHTTNIALKLHYWTPDWTWAACRCSQDSRETFSPATGGRGNACTDFPVIQPRNRLYTLVCTLFPTLITTHRMPKTRWKSIRRA